MRTWTIAGALEAAGTLQTLLVTPTPVDVTSVALPTGRRVPLRSVAPDAIADELTLVDPDLVVVDDLALAPLVLGRGWPVAVVSHNVESAVWADAAHRQGGPAVAIRRARAARLVEADVLARADQVWTVSAEDRDALIELGAATGRGSALVAVVPNAVPDPPLPDRRPQPGTAVFFGSLWWEPNQIAAEELIGLWARVGFGEGRRLVVAGSGAPDELRARLVATAGVEAPGFVDDLATLLATAACVVLPVTTGGGSMLKLIDAMAAGCPVLATPESARGIAGLEDGVHLVVRPLGPAFDTACAEMLDEPERFAELGHRAHRFVRDHLSSTAIAPVVAELVNRAVGGRRV